MNRDVTLTYDTYTQFCVLSSRLRDAGMEAEHTILNNALDDLMGYNDTDESECGFCGNMMPFCICEKES